MPPKMIFGAGAAFHSFGVEKPYNTLPAESTFGAGAKMSLSKEVFPPGPEAGDKASAGSGGLAFATTKQVPTLKESELSRQVEQVSNNMSEREESASNQLEQALKQCDALQQQLNDEYNRAGNLELQRDEFREQLAQCKTELVNSQRVQDDTEYTLKQSESTLVEEQNTIKSLEARNVKLERDLALSEAAIKDKAKQADNLTADYQQLFQALEVVSRERDDVREQLKDKVWEFDDLKDQWQSDQERIAELEETIKEHEDSNLVAELQSDIAGIIAKQEQDYRTIIVKDERISHLEAMLQKEQERNLHNADENARAAAASPVDDQRHIGSMGGTLEDEFSSLMLNENDFVEREPSEYEPAFETPSTIHVHEAASVRPVAAHVPRSTIAVYEAANVEPRKAASAPPSTIAVSKAASTEPMAVKVAIHAIAVCNAASVEPRDPMLAPPSTINFNVPVSTEPVVARVPIQTIELHEAASTEPEGARVPIRTIEFCKALSTSPIEPVRAPLSFNDVYDIASFAPEQPDGAPLVIEEQEVVNLSPQQPTPATSTIVRHEIANFAPKEPSLAVLTVSVTEAASTRPVARQTTSAELSTQTDAPATTTNFSTQTDAPTNTTDLSIQTDAPVVTTADFSAQTDAPALTSQLLSHAVLETTPIELSTQTAIIKPHNRIAPVMVTREIKPVEQVPPNPEPKRPTTTTGVQANINKHTGEEGAMTNTPPVMAASSQKVGFTDWIPMLLAVLFAVYSLVLNAELATWKNANGVGFGGGYGNVASRSGAYGNGRYLFGVFPIGMDIGNSWVSEQIARHMSVAISVIEDWVGIANEPLY